MTQYRLQKYTYLENVARQARPSVRVGLAAAFWPSGAYAMLFVAQSLSRHASQAAGFAAVTIAAAALIGWWAGLPLLSSWGSGFDPVKPVTALCLAALGLALVYPGRNSRFAFAAGLAVIAVAALDLFGVDFGINRSLVPRALGATSFQVINGMPVAIAVAGGSLALCRFEGHHFAATALGGLTGVMALFALLTYLIGIDPLYASIRPPPLPIVVGVLCVAGGIVLRIVTMAELRRPRPLWHLLTVLGCTIIAPLLLFGAYAELSIAGALVRHAQNDLMSEARTLLAEIDREVSGEIERLHALAASPSLRQGDFAEFQRQAEASLGGQAGSIILVDRNMRQVINTWVPFDALLPKSGAPGPIERALATGKAQVTDSLMRSATKQLMFSIIVPVEIDGENRYALVRSPTQRVLASLLAANELPSGWRAVVSDAAHQIIARSQQEDAFIGKELPSAQWPRGGPGGMFEFIDAEGRPSLQAYAWSELTGWQTAVWAPKALLEAPVRALWWTIGFTSLLAFALVVALATWLGRIIARSVGHAAHAAAAVGEGGPLPLNGTPVAEVDTLLAELRRAAARRRTAEHDLQTSKDRLQLAFDATQLGWWQYDPRRRVASGDARFKEIFDMTADEVPIEDLLKRVHLDDAARFLPNREAGLDQAEPEPYAHEYRVRRRDGKVRWVEGHGLPYFEGAGSDRRLVSLGGTVEDITEHKEREEKEHLLMREINHRAKNMLSVVDAIAHQTVANNPKDFVERFSERIQALSANQDLLVRNEWSGVEIEELVRAQLALFADLIGSRIAIHGLKLRLNAASAQAIGLALHELATNAGKYGALATDTGRIDIGWGTDGETFTMSWGEREGPLVSAPRRRGFGTIVMETMAERSVGGAAYLDYAPSGLTWRLTCPAANVLEQDSHRRGAER